MNKPECKIYSNGSKRWFFNGGLHREDGPAIEYPEGTKYWYLNGKRHREDGPAVEHPYGTKEWYLNNKRHREDGPAWENPNGKKEWYLNDKQVHPESLVDLWLERGVFCWYDQTTGTLNFGEQ